MSKYDVQSSLAVCMRLNQMSALLIDTLVVIGGVLSSCILTTRI